MKEIRVAIIGFGGIARSHYAGYEELRKEGYEIRVTAICERTLSRVFEKVEINLGGVDITIAPDTHLYSEIDELLAKEDFDIADICLPTFLHKSMSVKLLEAGKHVLCEKPMALSAEECEEMLSAARRSGKRLMIAQCLRFDPMYLYLKQCIEDMRFGKLQYLELNRHCDFPSWATDFNNSERTGGCILDTHIHDIDMARFLLGEPVSVSSVQFTRPRCQLVNSRLYYKDAVVIADVSWDEARKIPFEAGFRARFEQASVDFDGQDICIKPMGEAAYAPEINFKERITEEIRTFAELVANDGVENTVNPPESAAESVRLTEKLKLSASQNGKQLENK